MIGTYIPTIYERIEAFLSKRVLSSSGEFAPVSDEDLHHLQSAKWEPDADNDYPVEAIFVNRCERESFPYVPVMYRSISKDRNFKDIMFNLRASVRDVTLYFDLNEIEERSV